jgi:hypothetical protein
MRHQRNTVRWLPLSGAVAWALTRDKQFTVRASRAPAKCFVGDDLVYAGDKHKLHKPALEHYFDNAGAAWEHVCKEITNGKIKTNPPDWRVGGDENWLTNGSVKIDCAELQSVFPPNGPKLLTSKLIGAAPIRPSNVPYMSVTEAAYWIATKGGTDECVISNVEETWKPAFVELLKKICDGDLDLFGRRHGVGLNEKMPANVLADIPIDYPFQDGSELILSDDPYLECSGIGSSDNLFSGRQLQWSNLRVKGAQVARFWPFRKLSKSGPKECYDGERLREDVEARLKSEGPFARREQLTRWCLEPGRVKLKAGARLPRNKKRGDPPDAHTLDALLRRHEIFNIPGLIDKTS